MGYSFRLTASVLLYAPSHRQDSTYHALCYTSRGALAGTRNSSMGPPHEGSIRRPIAPCVNALTTELHLAPYIHTCMHTYINIYIHMHIFIHTDINACILIYKHTYMHTYLFISEDLSTHICLWVVCVFPLFVCCCCFN